MLNKKALAASVSAGPAEYVEDVFSTYLYTGNGGGTRSITNGIDLSGEGGLVWIKGRSGVSDHVLYDTARGSTPGRLYTNSTAAEDTSYQEFSSFNSDGFSIYHNADAGYINVNNTTYCSWTFRKAKKFFDVVTYTGNGSTQNINHNLGSVPGMIIVKRTNSGGTNWNVYHRSTGADNFLRLNTTDATANNTTIWNNTTPTSTQFTVGNLGAVNGNGDSYVAYLFAHDAGRFGTAGTDDVVMCGSWTTPSDGSFGEVNLGFEPQYILLKRTDGVENWYIFDNMRGISTGGNDPYLFANLSNAEVGSVDYIELTATGFKGNLTWGGNYIYMAIRRPMKTPTSGTEVFSPIVSSASQGTILTTGFAIDSQWAGVRAGDSDNITVIDRLRGTSTNTTESNGNFLETSNTGAENTGASASRARYWNNTGFQMPGAYSGGSMVFWNFSRRPGFFDIVCYTGNNGVATTQTHNLGVAPELMIIKGRNIAEGWQVYVSSLGNTKYLQLNSDSSEATATNRWNSTSPTSTVFSLGTSSSVNWSTNTYVAYLFATVAGVSKVGSYTGNGSSQTINCGFTAGARFVLIKRTDSTGDWYVYDTARGIVSGNDPQLKLNTTDAEATGYDAIDPDNSGFIVNNDATNFPINVNNATYIYLAIA